jgi:hypothetical protein
MPPRFSLNTDLTLRVNAPLDFFSYQWLQLSKEIKSMAPSALLLVLKIGIKLIHPTLIKLIRSIYSLEKRFGTLGQTLKEAWATSLPPQCLLQKYHLLQGAIT